MTLKQTKSLVGSIFGMIASRDEDIVSFYKEVNEVAFDEYAKEHAVGFADWIVDNNWFKMVGTTETWVNKYDTNGHRRKTTEELYTLYLKTLE
jgi:hypothetical protein